MLSCMVEIDSASRATFSCLLGKYLHTSASYSHSKPWSQQHIHRQSGKSLVWNSEPRNSSVGYCLCPMDPSHMLIVPSSRAGSFCIHSVARRVFAECGRGISRKSDIRAILYLRCSQSIIQPTSWQNPTRLEYSFYAGWKLEAHLGTRKIAKCGSPESPKIIHF